MVLPGNEKPGTHGDLGRGIEILDGVVQRHWPISYGLRGAGIVPADVLRLIDRIHDRESTRQRYESAESKCGMHVEKGIWYSLNLGKIFYNRRLNKTLAVTDGEKLKRHVHGF